MRARRIRPTAGAKIPAWEMIRHSVTIMRGCFGGCSFCSITEHEGRIIQSRSEDSILREIEDDPRQDRRASPASSPTSAGRPPTCTGMACKDQEIEAACRRLSCVYPGICKNLEHRPRRR